MGGVPLQPTFEREMMDTKVTIETEIQAAISRPMAYPEIESVVGKQRNPFALGIALTKMVLDGRLHYAFPDTFSAKWPVYSNKPIPKKFQHPKRDAMPPNAEVTGGPLAARPVD